MLRRTRCRRLLHEVLEKRELLAGDTYLINFQGDEATTPNRYLEDLGDVFGNRGNGFSYGWSSDHIDQARERSLLLDQRYDTLIHFEEGQFWEFALPAGRYEVTVAVGDPSNNDGLHTVNVEGVSFFSAAADTDDFMVATMEVDVSDGRLTLDQGAAANKATRINYVHIVGVSDGTNASPTAPLITEPSTDGQVVAPSDVHMEAVGYLDAEGDAHKSTDWEIWTASRFPELVWQTLGIEGVERLHTHLGDGVFTGELAGESELDANTIYELRARYRDDAGSVSSYSTRLFTTGSASTVFPLDLQDVAASPEPAWTTDTGAAVDLPAGPAILSPADEIIAIDRDGGGQSEYPGGESPDLAIDGTPAKYLNFGEVNSGFIVTPAAGQSVVARFQVTTADDSEERDPTGWRLYGTNDSIASADNSDGSGETWTLVDTGSLNLPSSRSTAGVSVPVNNSTLYASYRMVFTGVKDEAAANSMQIGEIQFFSNALGAPSEEPTLRLESASGDDTLLQIVGSEAAGNAVNDFAPLSGGENIRVVIEAGAKSLLLPPSDLTLTADGQVRTIFLPEIDLGPGQQLVLWVDLAGSTYFGAAGQAEPDFTTIAREARLSIPFVVTEPGFVIEEVGSDYRLPVNIAFVENPGPDPDDPLYFVAELYGSIQVVTRDGTKHEFATGLLDYNPDGPISGSGEQGLTGLAVQRDGVNPDIYHVYVGMLWDNGDPPGGASHYPKVERLSSSAGGLSIDTRTVLLNMQPETQGQSHQISNVSIGPDGLLYVHNGDGFDASTGLDLDQFRGKVLRMNLDGSPSTANPFYDPSDGITARDYVYAYGFRNPFGGAWRAADGKLYTVENGPSVDRLAQVNEGVSYGWDGSNASMLTGAIYNWVPSHAPVNISFVEPETFNGSALPAALQDMAFVSESGPTYAAGPQSLGKRITYFDLDENGDLQSGPETLVEYVGTGRGSVVAVAAGPDGIYFSEFYEDTGDNGPTASGSRIYRLRFVNPLEGDYDIDGDVDADDFLVWKETFGSNLLLAADGNGDGVVNSADFTVWRDAFADYQAIQTSVTAPAPTASAVSTANGNSPVQSVPSATATAPPTVGLDVTLATSVVLLRPNGVDFATRAPLDTAPSVSTDGGGDNRPATPLLTLLLSKEKRMTDDAAGPADDAFAELPSDPEGFPDKESDFGSLEDNGFYRDLAERGNL